MMESDGVYFNFVRTYAHVYVCLHTCMHAWIFLSISTHAHTRATDRHTQTHGVEVRHDRHHPGPDSDGKGAHLGFGFQGFQGL